VKLIDRGKDGRWWLEKGSLTEPKAGKEAISARKKAAHGERRKAPFENHSKLGTGREEKVGVVPTWEACCRRTPPFRGMVKKKITRGGNY